MKTNNPTGTLLILLIFFHCYIARAQNCNCERHAKLVEFTNPHEPDYEERLKEFNECMRIQLGGVSYLGDFPQVEEAAKYCADKEPSGKSYCWPSSVEGYLAQQLTSTCFHLFSSYYHNSEKNDATEYIFKGSYKVNPQGFNTIINDYGEEKLMIARMTIGLFYNGTSPELVKEWQAENAIENTYPLYRRLRIPYPINPIMDEFEKRPFTCNVETKIRMEMCKSGETEIILTDFKDKQGNPSKSFNRIMVTVRDGTILNGEKSIFGPDFRVFTLEKGEVILKYRKSESSQMDDKDLLRIYNSCDILPAEKQPLSKTRIDRMIKEEEIPLFCIAIHVRETESGSIKEGNPYPYSYTVSMRFTGDVINRKNNNIINEAWIGAHLPYTLWKMSMGEDITLIAELKPDEKSMKVENWQCSDPINNDPPLPLLGIGPPNYDVSEHSSVKIWQIGKKIYISDLGGAAYGYFPGYDDPRQPNNKEPLGARPSGFGGIGEYIEVPYEKFINGETIILHPKDVSDHNDDAWQWQTSLTVTINPY